MTNAFNVCMRKKKTHFQGHFVLTHGRCARQRNLAQPTKMQPTLCALDRNVEVDLSNQRLQLTNATNEKLNKDSTCASASLIHENYTSLDYSKWEELPGPSG